MDILAGKILGATERATYFLDNLQINSRPLFFIDIIIVTVLFYAIYAFLKETRAMRILYGFGVLGMLFAIGKIFNLALLNWILHSLTTMLVVAVPIVFQPELRAVLERVGRSKFFGERFFFREDMSDLISVIASASKRLSEKKTGALIVIQRQTGLREYAENGIELDAKISVQILLSIFFPHSALHDGAVIINNERIVSAKSTLPVSDAVLNSDLGMRHKAGVGITEISDALAVIVSEETGYISLAVGGKLERRLSEDRLRANLLVLMGKKQSMSSHSAEKESEGEVKTVN